LVKVHWVCGRHSDSTDGVTYYSQTCRSLKVEQHILHLPLRKDFLRGHALYQE
jgi:hypothetical protein